MSDERALCHDEFHGLDEVAAAALGSGDGLARDPALRASLVDRGRTALPEAEALAFLTSVFARKLEGQPVGVSQDFDVAGARRFVDALASLPACGRLADAVKATIIMPTYNRADSLERAICSALDQSHQNLELIVIDDGSGDGTAQILEKYRSDPRVRVFRNRHGGVCKARNTGLAHATGEVIFYLDSDNVWTRDFVSLMLASLQISNADCAYAASRLQGPTGQLVGYLGEPFNWDACVLGNYVDMNVFCHRRHLTAELGGFDEVLTRMVDWDLVLRYTKGRGAIYCPVVGCIYLEDSADLTRITTSQPFLFFKVVQEKNLLGLASAAETLKTLKFNIALKIPVSRKSRALWGDFEHAKALQVALTALGHAVRLDFDGKWCRYPVNTDDLAIVPHGLAEYMPRKTQLTLTWSVDHPGPACDGEAAVPFAALLAKALERDVQSVQPDSGAKHFGFAPHMPDSSGRRLLSPLTSS